MRNVLTALAVLLLIAGCAQKSSYNLDPQAKVFPEEDLYIFSALQAEEQQQYLQAADVYLELYDRTDKSEYLYRGLGLLNSVGAYSRVVGRTSREQVRHPDDKNLTRFEVVALLALGSYESAKEKSLNLVAESGTAQDYLLASEVYIKQRHYDTALKYLERAYAIDYDEEILDKMSIILYVNLGRKNEAIAHLESHSRLHGCSPVICKRLAGYYSEQNDPDGMLSTYLRLYEVDPKLEYAQAIAKIYSYKKEYVALMKFLEKSGADDLTLLQLYINAKNYAKASELSKKLYEERGDAVFLGQYAIFKYESAPNKHDKAMLIDVMESLERVVRVQEEGLYLNYLGYLMIDHDLDVQKGMGYVRRALKSDPDSPYYLDSLAWGYYKSGECEKAEATILKVVEQIGEEDAEVRDHVKAINECLGSSKE
jgi:hypothetical protein